MNKEHSLEEDVRHGTQEHPIETLHFMAGVGTCYPECFLVERHWHYHVELLYIVKGSYIIELNLEEYRLSAGDFCLVNTGELHRIQGMGTDIIHDVILFDPDITGFSYEDEMQKSVTGPLLARNVSMPHVIRTGDHGYEKVYHLYQKILDYGRERPPEWYLRAKLCLLELLVELHVCDQMVSASAAVSAPEKERIDRYKRTVTYMKEHFGEKVTLQQLAEAAQCNPQYLCHFFKDIGGISPMQYLIAYRIEKAREMLTDTTRTVLEISLDCGFDNVSYFIRQFKRETGQTPGQYRRHTEYQK